MKRGSKTSRPYTGPLATPEEYPPRPGPAAQLLLGYDDHEFKAAVRRALAKLPLLFEHFGIEPSDDPHLDTVRLVLRLAAEHVPGFQVQERPARGRPKGAGSPVEQWILLAELDRRGEGRQVPDASLAAELAAEAAVAAGRKATAGQVKTQQNRIAEARNTPIGRMWEHPELVPLLRETAAKLAKKSR